MIRLKNELRKLENFCDKYDKEIENILDDAILEYKEAGTEIGNWLSLEMDCEVSCECYPVADGAILQGGKMIVTIINRPKSVDKFNAKTIVGEHLNKIRKFRRFFKDFDIRFVSYVGGERIDDGPTREQMELDEEFWRNRNKDIDIFHRDDHDY